MYIFFYEKLIYFHNYYCLPRLIIIKFCLFYFTFFLFSDPLGGVTGLPDNNPPYTYFRLSAG